MDNILPLSKLPKGSEGKVKSNLANPEIRRRLQDMGLISGTLVRCVFKSPYGDPTAYLIRGALIALRKEDAEKILVSEVSGGI